MSQTPIQSIQISWELSEWQVKIKIMKGSFDLVNPRMRKLLNDKSYLELVLVFSQGAEIMIKTVIQGYKTKRNILAILDENDPYAGEKIEEKDDEPLGSLINCLRRFTGKIPLVEKLSRFNTGLRREVAHHIFDASNSKKIESLEKEIQDYFDEFSDSAPFRELVHELKMAVNKVDGEIKALVNTDI
jgi:hypothetical protein